MSILNQQNLRLCYLCDLCSAFKRSHLVLFHHQHSVPLCDNVFGYLFIYFLNKWHIEYCDL